MSARALRRWRAPAATSAALLTWSLLVVPALPPGAGLRAGANVLGLGALVAVVTWPGQRRGPGSHRRRALDAGELGLARSSWASGSTWGALALVVVAAFWALVLALAPGRALLAGAEGSEQALADVLVRAVVLIPVGTVVCEEVAFRAVLLAQARRAGGDGGALALSSVVFGLWHLGPALAGAGSPAQGPSALGVLATVAFTGAGGLVLGWLRLRSASVLAPLGLHLATNSLGLVAAAVAVRLGG